MRKQKRQAAFPDGKISKNAILDSAVIIIVIFIMGISSIIGYSVFTDINSDIQADTEITQEAKDVSGNLHTIYPSLMDDLFLFAFVLLVLFIIVSVFVIDTHPIFFIITIVLLVSVFIVAMLMANTYDDLASDTALQSSANNFPFISWINNNLVQLIIAIGLMVSIVMFVKFK